MTASRNVFVPLFMVLMGVFPAFAVPFTKHDFARQRQSPVQDSALRVMSFNIRYNTSQDGNHAWPNRKDNVASLIQFHRADLVGVQEALHDQIQDLEERLPAFGRIGVGRDDGKTAGEYAAIFYRKDRFEMMENGTFWLSETPEVPGSKSWDAAITRIVTWAHFKDRITGDAFYHFNTHFDHMGVQAREESARLLTQRMASIAGESPVICTGDFNIEDPSPAYAVLAQSLTDARRAAHEAPYGPEGTYQGFEVTTAPGRRIDYIFVANGVEVARYAALSDQWQGSYPSDHLPVLADVTLP